MTDPHPTEAEQNTHRAVIEFAVPPALVLIASGPREWCIERLTEYLKHHPVTPYDDSDPTSGGVPRILAIDPEENLIR